MKKNVIIVLSIILIALTIVGLYQTFASSNTVVEKDTDVYDITLTDNGSVVIPAKTSKTVLYQLCNTNKGKVQYGIGYVSTSSDVVVKEWWNTIDTVKGIIDYGENKFVKLKISNHGTEEATVTLNTILGYEKGGDLPSSEATLVTEKINEYNYLMSYSSEQTENDYFLGSSLTRNIISSVTFVDDNIVPVGMTSVPVDKDKNGTIKLWYGEANSDNLYDVYIGSDNGKTTLESGYYLFANMLYVESFDLKYVDTSQVDDMSYMFYFLGYYAPSIELTGLNNWDTSQVTTMFRMFDRAGFYDDTGNGAKTFIVSDLSNWDVSKVTNMRALFQGAGTSATEWSIGDLSHWDVSNVEDMGYMFSRASRKAKTWTIGDLSNWNVSKVEDMRGAFGYTGESADSWTIGDLSNWDVSKSKDLSHMFINTGSEATYWFIGDLSGWDVSNVENIGTMFQRTGRKSKVWSVGDIGKWDTSNITDMSYLFSGAGLSATTWFAGDLSKWNTSKVENMQQMFNEAGYSATDWNIGDLSTKEVTNADGSTYTAWDTSKVSNMNGMFYYAGVADSDWSLDLSNWTVTNVTDNGNFTYATGNKITPPNWVVTTTS